MRALHITEEMNNQAVLDAFQTALEEGNLSRAERIFDANEDLQARFDKIRRQVGDYDV